MWYNSIDITFSKWYTHHNSLQKLWKGREAIAQAEYFRWSSLSGPEQVKVKASAPCPLPHGPIWLGGGDNGWGICTHGPKRTEGTSHSVAYSFSLHMLGRPSTFRRRLWVAHGGMMWLLARGCALKEARVHRQQGYVEVGEAGSGQEQFLPLKQGLSLHAFQQ